MKKNKIFIFGLSLILLGFYSCNKEEIAKRNEPSSQFNYEVSSKIPYSSISKRDKGFKGTNGSTEILVFDNMQSIVLAIADLDRQVREMDSAFVSEFYYLSDEDRNEMEITLNFSAYRPLIDFNNYFLYYSLYQEIAQQEADWLNQEELDHSTDPDDHYIFEYSLRSILNTDCEVQVGDSIYKILEDGYFAMPASSFKSLEALNNDPSIYPELKDVIYIGTDCGTCKAVGCNSNKRNSGDKKSGTKKIKWVVSHWTHPWDRRVAAKVDNYKKSGWIWTKYSTSCAAKVYGYISNAAGQCDGQVNFNPNSVYATATAKHVEHKIIVQTKTKSGWVQSYFYGASGVSHSRTLTW